MPRGAELTSGCSLAISRTPFLLSTNTHLVQHLLPSAMATFRDAGISGDFVHEPLSDPNEELRLVQIDLSGDRDSEIHCRVTTHPIKDPPPYVAISYTWGDDNQVRGIWVNGGRLNIGHNSWLALWQARLHCVDRPLRIWMDVLSIDQANDIEKSIQVGLMGFIYNAAKYVLASVGVHEDDSEFLIEQVHATAEYVADCRRLEGEKEDPPANRRCCHDCAAQIKTGVYRCTSCVTAPILCADCYACNHTRKEYHSAIHLRKCFVCRRPLLHIWWARPWSYSHPARTLCRTCGSEPLYCKELARPEQQ
jgi:hypothetical protein